MTEFASSWLDVDENGMIDATKLSKQLGTTTRNYEKNDSNKAFIKALKEQLGKEVIVEGYRDGTGRKYHARVALDMARWHDPTFAVRLNGILMAYITGNLTTEDSVEAARALHQAISGSDAFVPGPSLAELTAKCNRQAAEIRTMTDKLKLANLLTGGFLTDDLGAIEAPPAEPTASSLSLNSDYFAELDQEDEGFDPADYIDNCQVAHKRRRD